MSTAISVGSSADGTGRAAPQRAAPGRRRVVAARVLRGVLVLGAAAGVLAGCGGSEQVYRSVPLERAISINRKATAAYEQGRYETALEGYREALRISQSIEHVDGIAANLLNLAAVSRSLGNEEQAAGALEVLLADGGLVFSPARRADAAYLRAVIFADARALADASRLAAQALTLCREGACGKAGRIVNLQARIADLSGDGPAALAAAQAALALNREEHADEETANSLRIAADVRRARGEWNQAAEGFAAALALDKSLGLPAKISLDLLRLGDVAVGQARREDALASYRRAREVSRGVADAAGTAEADVRIRSLGESR